MFFNSIDFAIFLPTLFILYWFVINKNLKLQNFLIVIASYIFYGWWDWRFLTLIQRNRRGKTMLFSENLKNFHE